MICEACERLWRSYEDAVFEHVRLSGRYKLAQASGDPDAIEETACAVASALEKRSAAREALLVHERESGHGYRVD